MSAPAPAEKGHRTTDMPPAEATGHGMRAHVGDEIVVRGTAPGVIAREGEVVGVHHPDGSPPYDVRWADTDRVTLYFPGPDAYIKHLAPTPTPDGHGS
ncbi:DUF1918 domain-containing protein [Streptomyces chiangmaiensis]|uniref:DUF1918 domain-containing protein n=1 Tax=Streptomyces chiangmaiensis TaxID=766497 RepID=A0ABU7FVD0_9ACTN|nr:DUF1918 domain-containing protein [Streptomyces chiangmaiensis]MED7827893.1 DUF1918 domain-containing protein [Streptomyces chiangmaiensis]